MSNLEHILLLFSLRVISGEEPLNNISRELAELASAYHYADNDDVFVEMNEKMSKKFGHLLHK